MKVVLVTGSRNWPDDGSVERELDAENPDALILGDCPTGADAYARRWARRCGKEHAIHFASWKLFGKRAGPKRNGEMVEDLDEHSGEGHLCSAVAFFDGGPGTADCINQLHAAGFEPRIVKPGKEAS